MKTNKSDRLNESLGARRGSKRTKTQSYRSRRHESAGMERHYGKKLCMQINLVEKD